MSIESLSAPLRIVLSGAESTGKSTLAESIAAHYDAPLVPEQVRLFVEREGRVPSASEVWMIVEAFLEAKERAEVNSNGIVVFDTDLISTVIYNQHYFGYIPRTLRRLSESYEGDIYFLAGDDIPWVPDGLQRESEGHRRFIQNEIREGLAGRSLEYVLLEGSVEDRLRVSIQHIDLCLQRLSSK